MKTILLPGQIAITLKRLVHQILENNQGEPVVIIGLQPRGIHMAEKLVQIIRDDFPQINLEYGLLDITFYRDDVRKGLHIANRTEIDFSIEDKKVVLVDDVLYTGRTIRAALDALLDFGRPAKVELCVLIDRKYSRQFPIQPDYVGRAIDSILSQKVKVLWSGKDGELTDEVVLLDN